MASNSSSAPEYAGFWQRVTALAIDVLIVLVVYLPLAVAVFGIRHKSLDLEARSWDLLTTLIVAIAVVVCWRRWGATPGKLAVGVTIVDARTGERPTTGRLALRAFAYIVSALPLYLGFLWVAIDRRKQGWHDKIARTVVIRED